MSGTRLLLALVLAWPLARGQTESAEQLLAAGERLASERTKASQGRARALFEQALARAKETANHAAEARAYYRLGQNAIYRDESRTAVAHFDQAIQLQRQLGLRLEETRSHNNKAVAQWQLGEATEALATYEVLLPLRHELKDQAGEALTLSGMANCYLSLGETAAALDRYREALAIWQTLGDKNGIAEVHNSLGNALVQLGEFDRAQADFEVAQTLWRATGNKLRLLYVRNNLGWVAVGRREYRRALAHLDGLVAELEPTGDRRAVAYVHHNLGSVYAGLHDPARAQESFRQSLAIKQETGDRVGEAYTLQALGELAATTEERLRYWEQALTIRRDVPDANGLIVTLGALARWHYEQKNFAAARQELTEAIELIESRRSALVSQDLRATYLSRKRDYYELLALVLLEQDETAEALAVAERARGRQLLDRLADSLAGVRKGVDPALLARERKLQQAINAAAENGARPRLAALLREARDVAEEIRRRSPRYASLVAPQPVSADRMQALLGPGEVLVQYLLGKEQSLVWTVTRTSLSAARLPAEAVVEELVRGLRRTVAGRGNWSAAAAALRRAIGPPRLPPAHRVIVAADGALESVPFALVFGEQYELAGLPSASALALRRSEPAASGRRIDILADPIFSPADGRLAKPAAAGSGRPRLRFSRVEAEAIAALAPAASRRVALDAAASRAFLQGSADAAVLHLATHAEIDAQHPELSGLALSQFDAEGRPVDGFLRLGEIFGLALRARLVTLSACRSAGGTDLPGEGLISLTRGFLYAGAGAVLASLWDVDDRATAELMKRFYQLHWQQKIAPPSALRQAQRLLRAEPGWEHPYYWAAFTLQGEWR